MKILVREYDDNNVCTYVWKNVRTIRPFSFGSYCTEDGAVYTPIKVLRIIHDFRLSGYVECGNCGKVIRKDRIVKHYLAQERNANCMKCNSLRLSSIPDAKTTRRLQPDGTVIVKTKKVACCGNNCYRSPKINEVNKAETCKYYACRRSEASQIRGDFLSQNPNPYGVLLSENAVIKNGWNLLQTNRSSRSYCNKNGKLIAHFDTNGILMYFSVMYRNMSFDFTYSDVYDKYMSNNGKEFDWHNMADTTKQKYIRQIKKLYE